MSGRALPGGSRAPRWSRPPSPPIPRWWWPGWWRSTVSRATGSGGTARSRASSPSSSSPGSGAAPACSPTSSSPSCATAGRPAAVLRGFRALYLALPINLIIMGWVTRAMVTILQISLDINAWTAALLLFGVTALLHHLLRPLGRRRHRHLPVRGEDGRRDRARRAWRSNSVGGLDEMVRQSSAHFGSYRRRSACSPPPAAPGSR